MGVGAPTWTTETGGGVWVGCGVWVGTGVRVAVGVRVMVGCGVGVSVGVAVGTAIAMVAGSTSIDTSECASPATSANLYVPAANSLAKTNDSAPPGGDAGNGGDQFGFTPINGHEQLNSSMKVSGSDVTYRHMQVGSHESVACRYKPYVHVVDAELGSQGSWKGSCGHSRLDCRRVRRTRNGR